MLTSKEIRQQSHLHTKNRVVTARRLADFLADLSSHEAVRQQRLRDLEGKAILESIEGTADNPASLPRGEAQTWEDISLYPVQAKIDVAGLQIFEEFH